MFKKNKPNNDPRDAERLWQIFAHSFHGLSPLTKNDELHYSSIVTTTSRSLGISIGINVGERKAVGIRRTGYRENNDWRRF
jgi:hypothetical protein